MEKLENISRDLNVFYPELQLLKKVEGCFKDVLKIKFKEFKTSKTIINNMILQTKTRQTSNWDERVYTYLEDVGLLHEAVSFNNPKVIKRYKLEKYQLPEEPSLRVSTKRITADEKEEFLTDFARKISNSEPEHPIVNEEELTKFLSQFDINTLINNFKSLKISLYQLDQKYNNRKKEILDNLLEEDKESYKTAFNHSFKVTNKPLKYDAAQIFQNDIEKYFEFQFKLLDDDEVELIDTLNDDLTFTFKKETIYEGMRISVYKGRIHVNGQRLDTSLRDLLNNPNSHLPAKGFAFVNSLDLFYNLKISSTKIDELIDEGLLEEKDVMIYKVADINSTQEVFEIISESSNEARKNMFKEKMEKRRKIIKEKTEQPVYNEKDFETESDEQDLFALKSFFD